jgi:hypothetical protein
LANPSATFRSRARDAGSLTEQEVEGIRGGAVSDPTLGQTGRDPQRTTIHSVRDVALVRLRLLAGLVSTR